MKPVADRRQTSVWWNENTVFPEKESTDVLLLPPLFIVLLNKNSLLNSKKS